MGFYLGEFFFAGRKLRRRFGVDRTRLNANSIATATWALFEMVQDSSLWKAVRDEAEPVFETNENGERVLNIQKLLSLPLLQSVYAETLRMHIASNITREVISETATVAGYRLPKNALVQAPTSIAHMNEQVWGVKGHPASEFWAYRHVRHQNDKVEFGMAAGPNDFFPYGMKPL